MSIGFQNHFSNYLLASPNGAGSIENVPLLGMKKMIIGQVIEVSVLCDFRTPRHKVGL